MAAERTAARLRLAILALGCWLASAAVAAAQSVPDQALHQAARTNDVELAEFALQRGAALEVRDPVGNTPLQVCAMYGSPAVATLLLERGADVAARTPDDDWTALHYAAYEGHDRVAEALVAAGAPLDAREGDYGNAPLHLAARRLKRPVVAVLLAA
ncbi:MAG TPA: ankyrin repeat domain-containing protein, partial [Kiloniellaceae bacterium]|nr:ankyrin repeat domain-containing protein [Kiloniellaceae bacterium]